MGVALKQLLIREKVLHFSAESIFSGKIKKKYGNALPVALVEVDKVAGNYLHNIIANCERFVRVSLRGRRRRRLLAVLWQSTRGW